MVAVDGDQRHQPDAAHVRDRRGEPHVAHVRPRAPRVGAGARVVAEVGHGIGGDDGEEEDRVGGGEALQQGGGGRALVALEGAEGERVAHQAGDAQQAARHAPHDEIEDGARLTRAHHRDDVVAVRAIIGARRRPPSLCLSHRRSASTSSLYTQSFRCRTPTARQ